ncbi:uncharacterized protein BXZ73DRAFT_88427 [Epithele typhae]|uniref:uncharacterized protein n=1 Tax=Epithele typhae TaxID=378194 RepID=UPI002007F56C|nr:uncharacterized protein BXZ73DRAFT_88427 [Epithele typhae]KAH9941284.1 hypothetical protein BXZ73DRAFT_88427 [Epithele typhae]
MCPFLELPDELLADITAYLGAREHISLLPVCRRLYALVQSHAAFQYAIGLFAAGMVDHPASPLVSGEKLYALKHKEEAWGRLDLSNRKTIMMPLNPSGIYDLTGGLALFGERLIPTSNLGTDAVWTLPLNDACNSEEPELFHLWSRLDVGLRVIDVGLNIHEHDLIAVVTYNYVAAAELLASIDIHFRQSLTGQPHPAATQKVMHIDTIHYLPGQCSIMLEFSGDTMVFLLNNYFPFLTEDAHRKFGDPDMVTSFILLDPWTIVLPMTYTHTLEICHFGVDVPHTTKDPFEILPLCILELPPLSYGALAIRATCRCEPNVRGPDSPARPPRTTPFSSDPAVALMVLHVAVRLPDASHSMFTMFVHRSTLQHLFRAALRFNSASHGSSPTPDPPSPAFRRVQPSHTTSTDVDGPPPPPPEETLPLALGWKQWGPARCRWFEDDRGRTRWITTTCGQRYVRLTEDGRLHAFDFNQRALRRHIGERERAGEPVGTREVESVLESEEERSGEVWMEFPVGDVIEAFEDGEEEMEDEEEGEFAPAVGLDSDSDSNMDMDSVIFSIPCALNGHQLAALRHLQPH